jgi:hypothetical protein
MSMVLLSCNFTYFVDLTISSYNSCPMKLQRESQCKNKTMVSYRRNSIISRVLWRKGYRARHGCSKQGRICPSCVRLLAWISSRRDWTKKETNHDMLQNRASSYWIIINVSYVCMSVRNVNTPAGNFKSDLKWRQSNSSTYHFGPIWWPWMDRHQIVWQN